jgi:hypothetical protein
MGHRGTQGVEARMTREEAHAKLLEGTRSSCTEGQMVDFIDMALALGMLKLDEPKSAEQKLKEHLTADGYGAYAADSFIRGIDSAGLKIVEK